MVPPDVTPRRKPKAAERRALEAAVGCARIADEGRGMSITVLHVEKVIMVTDFFVITSARNKRQAKAIARDVKDYLKEAGFRGVRLEGYDEGLWVLVDAGTVVVHIFREELRSFYDLELLWGDAPEIPWRGA